MLRLTSGCKPQQYVPRIHPVCFVPGRNQQNHPDNEAGLRLNQSLRLTDSRERALGGGLVRPKTSDRCLFRLFWGIPLIFMEQRGLL